MRSIDKTGMRKLQAKGFGAGTCGDAHQVTMKTKIRNGHACIGGSEAPRGSNCMKSRKRSCAVRLNCRAAFVWLLLLFSIIFPPFVEAETDLPATAPPTLDALIQEALAESPMIASARKHWEALTKVPVQVSTLPDPMIGLQQLTVGNPQPF